MRKTAIALWLNRLRGCTVFLVTWVRNRPGGKIFSPDLAFCIRETLNSDTVFQRDNRFSIHKNMYTSIEVRMERKEKVSKAQTCVAMTAPDEETFIAVSVAAIDHSRRKQNFGGIFEFPWRIRSQSGHVPSEMSHWTKLRVRELIMNQQLHFQNVIPITRANSDIFQHYVIIKPTNDGFPLAEIVDIQRLRYSCGFLRYFHAVARFIIGRENGETVRIVLSSPAIQKQHASNALILVEQFLQKITEKRKTKKLFHLAGFEPTSPKNSATPQAIEPQGY